MRDQFSIRNLFRLLTFAAIIFAAGISGSWLGEQMHAPLPMWWGWFGAGLAGLSIFGGVILSVRGEPAGWAVVIVGAGAALVMDVMFFHVEHSLWTAIPLGLFPSMIAILGGYIEARLQVVEERGEAEADERAYEREKEQDEAERKHELELARIEARTRARIAEVEAKARDQTTSDTPDSDQTTSGQPADKQTRHRTLADMEAVDVSDVADRFGVSKRTVRRDLDALGFVANGDGRWRSQRGNGAG